MKKNYLFISLFVCLFIGLITLNLITHKSIAYSNKKMESFSYEISFIDSNGGLYGNSNDGKGLYFSSDKLSLKENLKLGDKVEAWFPIGEYDSVIKVRKINE